MKKTKKKKKNKDDGKSGPRVGDKGDFEGIVFFGWLRSNFPRVLLVSDRLLFFPFPADHLSKIVTMLQFFRCKHFTIDIAEKRYPFLLIAVMRRFSAATLAIV